MMLKKLLAVLLVTIAVLICCPMVALASLTEEVMLPAVEPPSFGSTATNDDVLDNYVDIAAFRDYIFSNTYSCQKTIDLSLFNLPATDNVVNAIYQFIWYQMPEAFNFKTCGFVYNRITQKLVDMSGVSYYEFADTAAEFSACWEAYERAADKLLYGIEGNTYLADEEKALLLHDRLAIWNEYDYNGYLTNSLPHESYTAYGALVNRTSVCQGYALAYDYLLERVGIRGDLCPSVSLNHIWNIIYIDGLAYHVDVTWDDPVWDMTGQVLHTNFLRSSNGMKQTDHIANDYDTTPWSTKYDAYYWQNSDAEFRLVNNTLYYIDSQAQTINKANGQYTSVVLEIPGTWTFDGGYWKGCYSRLSSIGGELLYSMPNAIYAYNTVTHEKKVVYTSDSGGDKHIYGFAYEDGYLICENTTSPNYTEATKSSAQAKTAYYGTYVRPSSVTLTALSDTNKVYYVGDTLDIRNYMLTVTFSDGSKNILYNNFTISGFSSATAGTKTATVSYGGASTTLTVTVKKPTITFKQNTLSFGCNTGSASLNITTVPSGQTVTCKSTDRNVALPYHSGGDDRIQIGTSGTAVITASFTYNGVTYSNTCTVTVNRSHNYKTTTTPAGFGVNGKTVSACAECGLVQSTTTIYAPISATLSTTTYTYNGSVRTPSVTVKDSTGKVLTQNTHYTVTYPTGRKNAGTYTVKITFKGNYTGTKYLSFTIKPIDVSKCTMKLSTTAYTYNGAVRTPSVTVTNANGTKLTKNTHYTVTYASGRKNAGTYKVTVKMIGNYGGTKTLSFKINPISISKCTVKLSKTSFTYNGSTPTLPIVVKNANGTVLTKGTHYTVLRVTGGKNAGKHQVKVKMKGNYSGSKTLNYTIEPMSISKCTVKLANTSLIYDGTTLPVSVSVTNANGTKLTKNTHYTVKRVTGGKNVGVHKVLVTMKGNYSGSKTLTYKIFPQTTSIKQLQLQGSKLTVSVVQRTAQVSGYQVQHSTSNAFSGAATVTVSGNKNTKLPITVPTAKGTYYVRVRTYKIVDGVRYCSYWETYSYKRT